MIASIKTLLESVIADNKSFIKAYTETGNIRSYFAGNIEQNPEEYRFYLSDEEIEIYESDKDKREELMYPVWDLLDEYNMSIEDFLGCKVEPAY